MAQPAPAGPPPAAVHAAFFDLDNTMVRGASLFYLARGLAARGLLPRRELRHLARRALRYAVRGEDLRHLVEVRDLALALVAGRTTAELRAIGEEVYDEHVEARVHAATQDLAQRHLSAGAPVWLVTAAPIELAGVVARRLGLTGALGTVAEEDDGVYTGRLRGEALHGRAKADAVRELAGREGFQLSRCAAYSDSANDLPLLSMVGWPVAVNPDAALRRHARARGWPVRERRWRHAVRWTARAAAVGVAVVGVAGLALSRARRRGQEA